MACSTPPMYWSMGNQYCAMGEPKGGVAVEVPAGIDEGVHRVSLAARRAPAFGAGDVYEVRHAGERRAALLRDLDLFRKHDGKLIVGNGNEAIALAVDHGDGRAPVALTAYTPVFEAEGDGGFSKPAACGSLLKLLLGLGAGEAVVLAGVDEQAVFGDEGELRFVVAWDGLNHLPDLDAVFCGEFVVALVVGGHAHDGAGAVVQEHVIGDPDGHLLAAIWVDGEAAGGNAVLFNGADVAGFSRLLLLFNERSDLGAERGVVCGQHGDKRVLRG
jgi:hypothetical protein